MAGPWESYQATDRGPWSDYSPSNPEAPKAPSKPSLLDTAVKGSMEGFSKGGALAMIPGAIGAIGSDPNTGLGALRGASNIGSTLLRPVDAAIDAVTGKTDQNLSSLVTGKKPLSTNETRRQKLNEFFQQNADPESGAFKLGEIGTEIAGTSGVGGLLSKIPGLAQVAPKLASSLQSGGFSLNAPAATTVGGKLANAATRVGGGAAVGGASAGLVDPDSAGTGAAIGGALPGAVKVAGAVGGALRSAAEHILGAMTGTGAESVKTAFQAGKTGSKEFLENMRGNVSFEDVVAKAKEGLRNMRLERGNQYRSGMVDIKNDKSVLDMEPIVKSVQDLQTSGSFKGKTINEKSAGTTKEIADRVNDWAASNPAEFHTPEGLDALKQAVGDIRDSTQFGTPARRSADVVYNTIKNQISKQAPTYSKVMGDYAEASKTLSEVERALSLGEKSSKDTAIRKLQSLMRNNAQTNYGNRLDLAKTLEEKGGVNLGPAIAGQSMNSLMPRGVIGSIEKAGMMGAPFVAPHALMLAPLTSPRLVGEAAYGLGMASGGVGGLLSDATRGALPNQAGGLLSMEDPTIRALLYRGALSQSNP